MVASMPPLFASSPSRSSSRRRLCLAAAALLLQAQPAQAWSYDIYGICSFYHDEIELYEYDGTHLASAAPAKAGAKTASFGQVTSSGGYHQFDSHAIPAPAAGGCGPGGCGLGARLVQTFANDCKHPTIRHH